MLHVVAGGVAAPGAADLDDSPVRGDPVKAKRLGDNRRGSLEDELPQPQGGGAGGDVGTPSWRISRPSVPGLSGWPARRPRNSQRAPGLAAVCMLPRLAAACSSRAANGSVTGVGGPPSQIRT
jgi:hypothetical protein